MRSAREPGRGFVLPDRNSVGMTVPFMRAYSELLVATCHKRGAFAIGGMAAFIPSRTNPEVNDKAMAEVHEDKAREANDGYDGSWVAHPDLAEISRSQVWQWVHNDVELDNGRQVTSDYVRQVIDEELDKIKESVGEETFEKGRWQEARDVFESVALADDYVEFLTLPAYELID